MNSLKETLQHIRRALLEANTGKLDAAIEQAKADGFTAEQLVQSAQSTQMSTFSDIINAKVSVMFTESNMAALNHPETTKQAPVTRESLVVFAETMERFGVPGMVTSLDRAIAMAGEATSVGLLSKWSPQSNTVDLENILAMDNDALLKAAGERPYVNATQQVPFDATSNIAFLQTNHLYGVAQTALSLGSDVPHVDALARLKERLSTAPTNPYLQFDNTSGTPG